MAASGGGSRAAAGVAAGAAGPGDGAFREHRVQVEGGARRLLCADYGVPDGRPPIVYLHGFLGSRFEIRAAGPIAARILAPDRPGYGGSQPMRPPSLRRFGADLGELMGRIGVPRFSLVGVSAGAPYAAAAAGVLGPGRVANLVLAGPMADRATTLEAGGGARALERFRRHRALIARLMPRLVRQARQHGLDARFIRRVVRGEGDRFGPVDPDRIRRDLLVSMREGLRPGLEGFLADVDVLTGEWDVDPAEAEGVPTLILHGREDALVPPPHALWYARRMPGATLEFTEGQAHVSMIVNSVDRILRACDEAAGGRALAGAPPAAPVPAR